MDDFFKQLLTLNIKTIARTAEVPNIGQMLVHIGSHPADITVPVFRISFSSYASGLCPVSMMPNTPAENVIERWKMAYEVLEELDLKEVGTELYQHCMQTAPELCTAPIATTGGRVQ